MSFIKNITRYFKQSLIDAERLCPADRDLLPALGLAKSKQPTNAYIALDNRAWQTGCINPDLAQKIIAAKQPKGKPPLQEVELVLFPRVDLFRYQGGWGSNRKRRVLLPLVVFVRLQADGQLAPAGKAPWIPREWLAPNQSATQPFADYAVVDEFLTLHPFEGIGTWHQLEAYCTALLCAATGTPYTPPDNEHGARATSLFEVAVHPDYQLTEQCLLQIEPGVVGAKDKIVKVLDTLLEARTQPSLYQRFCAEGAPTLEPDQNLQYDFALAKAHLAQMTGEFPLSPNQRNALHHFLKQEKGEILAVNGPPGTGKTTLLRSVVAQLWSHAALEESEPPLIVATSNNNQAVTNILESFAKVDEEGLDENLKGRWLPEISSYGLYCCASNKANEKNPYMYLGPRGEGCMEAWQTQEYLDRATTYFLDKASQWQGRSCTDLPEAKQQLHQALREVQQAIGTGIDNLAAFQQVERELTERYGSIEALFEAFTVAEQLRDSSTIEYNNAKSRLDALYALWEQRSLWVRLLMWLPSIRKQEQRKNTRLLNSWDLHLDDSADDTVESWLTSRIRQAKQELEQAQKQLAELSKNRDAYEQAKSVLINWISTYRPPKLFAEALADQVSEVNDRVLRFQLFKLATHYWEARWLLELKAFFDCGDSDKKSPAKMLRKLRRFAKLTPCFVSTFYMVPSTFMAGEFQDDIWRDIPLFDEIDLLIVDEAGQALPEVAAASFALAKRALIVGDTDQIEPVWSIPASVDRANLKLFELLTDEQQYDAFWLQSGLLASSGNVMKVAQRQCLYHQFSELQRGLYLTEHRRCYDRIVSYCNALVYKGILEPLRGGPKVEVPWGMLSMIPVEEASRAYGGSRGNPGEARRIAQWLAIERSRILTYARCCNPKWMDLDDEVVLKRAVGIVTPFSKQAALIRGALKEKGITGLTVGTVHSLQGDERIIVLFSSVYGVNDRSTGKFYDRGPNMLNVAVSRAKDSFVVFGHPEVFGATNAGSPSGLLRQYLAILTNGEASTVC